jgi:4'-phosphopantetheinyl transferase
MPDAPDVRRYGPVRVAVLAHPAGVPAESIARDWIAAVVACAPAAVTFERGRHGRPSLQLDGAPTALDCNWSHSGDRLAIALGEGVRVGIDIEHPRPRPRALELARRYFTAAEAEALAALPVALREAAFLRLWCAKEAVLKAHGRGLAFGLDRLRFEGLGGAVRLVETDPALGAADDWALQALDTGGLVGVLAWRTA